VRETADALLITENTARSTLAVVYGKLAISKQSELSRIVARLDGFGVPVSRLREYEGAL
jgi:DNA-binding CsgD family transcriptional regulator